MQLQTVNCRCADDAKRIALLAGTMGVELDRKSQEVKDLKKNIFQVPSMSAMIFETIYFQGVQFRNVIYLYMLRMWSVVLWEWTVCLVEQRKSLP